MENAVSKAVLERKRKMMLMLPILFVPMLVIGFYALGGGKGDAPAVVQKGINTSLPAAQFDSSSKPMDKQAYYDKARRDSEQLAARINADPYRMKDPEVKKDSGSAGHVEGGKTGGVLKGSVGSAKAAVVAPHPEATAELALRKLEVVRGNLERSAPSKEAGGGDGERQQVAGGWVRDNIGTASGLERLGRRMSSKSDGGQDTPDPEMVRIDGMLDKLLRIQHPETMKDTVGRVEDRQLSMLVKDSGGRVISDLGDADGGSEDEGFMEIGERSELVGAREHALGAVVNANEVVTGGATVELRLSEPAMLNGVAVPENQLLYGVAGLSGDRLLVTVSSISVGQAIVPVLLEVYDLDGIRGIRVRGSVANDVSRESANQVISGIGVAPLDPSLAGQAANAGLQFARSLAGRKVRQVSIPVPAGYRVLLRNKSVNH